MFIEVKDKLLDFTVLISAAKEEAIKDLIKKNRVEFDKLLVKHFKKILVVEDSERRSEESFTCPCGGEIKKTERLSSGTRYKDGEEIYMCTTCGYQNTLHLMIIREKK